MGADYFKAGDRASVNDTGERCIVEEQRPVGLAMFYVVVDEDGGRRRVIAHYRLRRPPTAQAHAQAH